MLGSTQPYQRLPNFDSTTASTGRQSQLRLSASPRPGSPSPLSGFLASADSDIRAD